MVSTIVTLALIISLMSLSAPVAMNWSVKVLFPSTISLFGMRMGTPISLSLVRKSSVNSLLPFGVVKSTPEDRNRKS